VPELLQDEATPEKLAEATIKLVNDVAYANEIRQEFTKIHHSLRQNTAEKAAEAVLAHLPA
jgi:lipid-A-disaccharide synthase